MAAPALPYRWALAEFVRAWEAGAFDRRVELVDGEVLAVPIGDWHGDTAARVVRALPNDRFRVSTASLPTAESLPDPDCWVRPAAASASSAVSARVSRWATDDVLLVVEVADETVDHDLGAKAVLYAGAGYPCYWAITRDGVYEHTGPTPAGYRHRVLHRPGDAVPVGYAGTALDVTALVG